MRVILSTFLVSVVFIAFGCGSGDRKTDHNPQDATSRSKVPPLPHMQPSMEALAATVVQAIADSNVDVLYNLVVTKDEYRDVVWANLDPSEINGLSMDEAWGWNARDIDKAITRFAGDYGHKNLQFLRVNPPRETRERNEIKVHRGNWINVSVRDNEDEVWRLLNVVLEYKGWFKVIAYND